MKRIVTGLALASAATLIAAAPAQAAPVNPAAAVQKQYAAGKGVKFAEVVKMVYKGERDILLRRSGTLQFGSSGVVASDITGQLNIKRSDVEALSDILADEDEPELGETLVTALTTPERIVTVGKSTYLTGGLWSALLNSNKGWIKIPGTAPVGLTSTYSQPLNIVGEPATLKTLMKGAKATKDGFYGKISAGELSKVSPTFRNTPGINVKKAKGAISWKLSVDAKGLPVRLASAFPSSVLGMTPKGVTISVETRYSDWGTPVTVTAPPELEVAKTLEEAIDLPGPKSIPLSAIVH
ncbi:hypothetical protein [Nonomuraea indica]|uniref:Uncharacterized protein n=1 Tax=Nonomuraea indica TaxID=1581193 RepID=A0ABW8A3T8_9ACTN|nr:hypothetical protein [Nonomuraea indica]